jgi:hypothetical protein
VKKLIELVKYLTKKSEISHYSPNLIRVSQIGISLKKVLFPSSFQGQNRVDPFFSSFFSHIGWTHCNILDKKVIFRSTGMAEVCVGPD